MLLKSTIIFFWKSAHVFQHSFSLHFLDYFQDMGCNVLVLNFGNVSLSASKIIKKLFSSFTVLVTQRQFSVLFACEITDFAPSLSIISVTKPQIMMNTYMF